MPNFTHGKNGKVRLDNAAGSLTDITTYVDSITFNPTSDIAETSTLGTTSKQYVLGLKDCTFSIEGPYEPVIAAIINSALGSATSKSLEFSPQGETSGLDKWSCEAFATSISLSTDMSGAARYSADFQVTGAVTLATI
jgi:hypothetical protein